MRRVWLASLALAALLGLGQSANAQYWGGWGGWGGGATSLPEGLGIGLGVFANGIGQMNLADAQAANINAQTMMQWNNYEWAISQSIYADHNRRLIQNAQETARSVGEIQKRLRDNPTPQDIQSGRALNAILDDFQNPKVQLTALKISEPQLVPAMLVKRIPFFYTSDPFTFTLHQFMDGKVQVPEPLTRPEFAAERQRVKDLAAQAKKEDEASEAADISEDTINKLNAATKSLRDKFETRYPPGTREYVDSEPFLKALVGFTTMLKSDDFKKELEKLEANQQVSLNKLLTFMTAYSLRFGNAETPDARSAYQQLFPVMAERRREILALIAEHTPPEGAPMPTATAPATSVFRTLDFDQLDKTTKTPKPPKPFVPPSDK
jgi:hypothetical protein